MSVKKAVVVEIPALFQDAHLKIGVQWVENVIVFIGLGYAGTLAYEKKHHDRF